MAEKVDSSNELTELPDRWTVPLADREVVRCLVDYAFSLEFFIDTNEYARLRIGSSFCLENQGNQECFDPAQDPAALGAALGLLHKTVRGVTAWKSGNLEIGFTDGMLLTVPFDPRYEAWQLAGPNKIFIVSLPGGGLGVWG